MKKQELSTGKVLQYSVGSAGNNFCFVLISTYIMFFYTDVMGLSGLVAGLVFMVARIIDALTDPLMGMIIDRTNSKHFGKYRPYLIFAAPVMGIAFVLMFTCPNLSLAGRTVYAFVTYIVYSLAWTAIQTPYLAMPIMFSSDVSRRTKFIAIIQGVGGIGGIVPMAFAIPILNQFGGKYDPHAWTMLTIILGTAFVLTTWVAAHATKKLDVYQPVKEEVETAKPKVSLRHQMRAIFANPAILLVILGFATDAIALQLANSLNLYFLQYLMNGRTDLMGISGVFGLVAMIIDLFFMGKFAKMFGKRVGICILEAGSILVSLGMIYVGANSWALGFIVLSFFHAIFYGSNNIITRAAVLDSANYAEWKLGIRADALVSSSFTFANKVSQALGAFLMGIAIDAIGYVPQAATQSAATLKGILYLKTLVPIAAYAITIIAMYFYPIKKKDEAEMSKAIAERRAAQTEAAE